MTVKQFNSYKINDTKYLVLVLIFLNPLREFCQSKIMGFGIRSCLLIGYCFYFNSLHLFSLVIRPDTLYDSQQYQKAFHPSLSSNGCGKFRGCRDKNFEGYPVKNSSFLIHLFTAYGFCYFLFFFLILFTCPFHFSSEF